LLITRRHSTSSLATSTTLSRSRGDLISVPVTGAYCYSLASNYNHVPRPAVVSVRDGRLRTLIRRETEDDLLALDQGQEVVLRLADRKSTRLNSSHVSISYAVFC